MNKAKHVFAKGVNNIGYVDSDFTKEYGEEEVNPGRVLVGKKLERSMTDTEIISEFKVQEVTIGDVFATMNAAPEDMKDGYSNIFYVKGQSRVVSVSWRGGEWCVHAWDRGSGWRAGRRVFSPATSDSQNLNTGTLNPVALTKYCECPRCEKCKLLIK